VSAADAGGRGEPDIEALRALLDAAPSPPWEWWTSNSRRLLMSGAYFGHRHAHENLMWAARMREGDADIECADGVAALIVAAVNALPSLLASLAAARAERDAARDALRFYADPASWEGRDDYIEGEHVERFDPEAFDDKGTRARAALAARPPAAPSGAPASDARPAPGRAEARTYEDGIDAAVAAVLARYDICARNHEAATYLTHGKISDDEPTLDRMEWAARRSEAMKCRDAIRALAAAPPAPATRECCPTCRSNTRAWRGTIPYHSAQSGIQIGTMACDDVWHDAAEAPAPGREGAK
jgi:hypothetical protein